MGLGNRSSGIPVPECKQKTLFAASLTRLYVVQSEEGIVQRWNLATIECESSKKLPITDPVTRIVTGSGVDGHLLIVSGKEKKVAQLLDSDTLETIALKNDDDKVPFEKGELETNLVSPNGKLFTWWNLVVNTPNGVHSLVLKDNSFETFFRHDSYGFVLLGSDGRIHCPNGILTAEGKEFLKRNELSESFLPVEQGNYYVQLVVPRMDPTKQWVLKRTMLFKIHGEDRALADLGEVNPSLSTHLLSKRIALVPEARLWA